MPRPFVLFVLMSCWAGCAPPAAEPPLSPRWAAPEGLGRALSAGAPTRVLLFVDFACPEAVQALSRWQARAEAAPLSLSLLPFGLADHPGGRAAAELLLSAPEARLPALLAALSKTPLSAARLAELREVYGPPSVSAVEEAAQIEGLARRLQLRTAPSALINGFLLEGAQPEENIQVVLKAEAARLAAGTPAPAVLSARPVLAAGPARRRVEPTANAPRLGPASAPVQLLWFADAESGPSRRQARVLSAYWETGPEGVSIVAQPWPILPGRRGRVAALALLTARGSEKQRAKLQAGLTRGLTPAQLASRLKIGLSAWRRRWRGQAAAAELEASVALARRLGARGVPTVFVNGRRFEGLWSVASLSAVIEEERARVLRLKVADIKGWEAARFRGPAGPAPRPQEPRARDARQGILLVTETSTRSAIAFIDPSCVWSSGRPKALRARARREESSLSVVLTPRTEAGRQRARAALAAARLGAGAPYLSALLDRPELVYPAELAALGGRLGLDEARFLALAQTPAIGRELEVGMALARALGVARTPSIFVDGRRVLDATP